MARKSKLPKLLAPNPAELEWVAKNVGDAPELIEHLTNENVEGDVTLEQLDEAWACWLQIADENPQALNPVINILGLAFGQILVRELGMEWTVASDGRRTEMAVLGQPGDRLAYPTVSVAKRWETRETGFFARLFEAFADHRQRLTDPGDNPQA